MRTPLFLVSVASLAFASLLALSACPTKVGTGVNGCENARDCAPGQACTDGQCVTASGCTLDTDCPTGQVCTAGACGTVQSTTCTNTSDCPIDQFCNTATGACAALADGFCRQATQCPASAPVCSAQSSDVPGRCVQCLQNQDCTEAGAQCVQPGVCSGGNNNVCPPNATPNQNGGCICNPGFHQALGGPGCVPNDTGGEGEGSGGEGEGSTGGEGEGSGPGPACTGSGASADLQCLAAGSQFNKCSNGTCTCDANTLAFDCVLFDPNAVDIDTDTCTCIDGAGEGEGEGGAGEGEGSAGEGEGSAGEGEGEGGGDPTLCSECINNFNQGNCGVDDDCGADGFCGIDGFCSGPSDSSCESSWQTCASSNACADVFNCENGGGTNSNGTACAAGDLTCCEAGRSSSTKSKYSAVASCFCQPSNCGDVCGGGTLPTCSP